jgi:hypothetical protein
MFATKPANPPAGAFSGLRPALPRRAGGGEPAPADTGPTEVRGVVRTRPAGAAKASPVSDELADALARLAEEYAAPAATTTPFVTLQQREAEARARRRAVRWRLAKVGAVAAVGLLAVHVLVTQVLFRYPKPEDLDAEAMKIAQAVVLLHSSGQQPLVIARAVAVPRDSFAPQDRRYYAEITLRLRHALYRPAQTNGTATYKQLQLSLARAREDAQKLRFVSDAKLPDPPAMPPLLQMVHRAGEPLAVRVPFEARRFAWKWRFPPAVLANRTVDKRFEGMVLDQFEPPFLVFGAFEGMPEIRARMRAARDFIVAVTQQVQRHSDGSAVADTPPAVAPEDLPAIADLPVGFDPDKPAIDPEAPALEADPSGVAPELPTDPAPPPPVRPPDNG